MHSRGSGRLNLAEEYLQSSKRPIAMVTGASGRIGSAICRKLAADGHDVIVHYFQNRDAAEQVVEDVRATGAEAGSYHADLRDWKQIDRLFQEVSQDLGDLSVLVNNAGEVAMPLRRTIEQERWESMVALNLGGPYRCTQLALNMMRRAGFGRVIMIGSAAGALGGVGQAVYASTKSGLFGMVNSFARECAPFGITVNIVSPGFIDDVELPAALKTKFVRLVPLGRLGTREEVATMVCYLCSRDAGYVTGQVFSIDGGLTDTSHAP